MLLLGAAAAFAAELRGLHPIVLIVAATLIGRFRRLSASPERTGCEPSDRGP